MARPKKAGNGKFLVASYDGQGTKIYRNPESGKDDLVLVSDTPVVIDRSWTSVPHFARDVQNGIVDLKESDTVPNHADHSIRSDYMQLLDDNLRHIILTIAQMPFDAQMRSIVNVASLLGKTGVAPTNVRVTREYATTTHRSFLQALLDLEKRWKNRPEVISEVAEALKKIEALGK